MAGFMAGYPASSFEPPSVNIVSNKTLEPRCEQLTQCNNVVENNDLKNPVKFMDTHNKEVDGCSSQPARQGNDLSDNFTGFISLGQLTALAMQTTQRINSVKEVCWFITLYIDNYPVTMLLDTGAGRTMLNACIFSELQKSGLTSRMRPTMVKLVTASGDFMPVEGAINATFHIGQYNRKHTVLVANLGGVSGVLGMDFIQNITGPIELSSGILTLGSHSIFLHRESQAKGHALTVNNFHTVLPGETLVIKGSVEMEGSPSTIYTISLAKVTMAQKKLVIDSQHSLEELSIEQIKHIQFSISNNSERGINLYTGEVLGHMAPCYDQHGDGYISDDFLVQNEPEMEILCMVTDQPDSEASDNEENDWKVCVNKHLDETGNNEFGVPAHLANLLENTLSREQKFQLASLLREYKDVFVGPDGKLGRTTIIKHTINTGNSPPIKLAPRRLPLSKLDIMETELDKMLQAGVITPSKSPWAAPIVLVTKSDRSTRFCVDYRLLNNITQKDAYPLPRIDDCFDTLSGASWFCTIDLASGYWQVEMDPHDREKTAFTTQYGLYEFTVMPFGLCNAPATFERLMESVLQGYQWRSCIVYLDDVTVFGVTYNETLDRLSAILRCFQAANLKLKPQKCQFFKREVKFLGHIVSGMGIQCDPSKVEKVIHWPEPTCLKELQSFLGFTNYYRRFVERYSSRVAPLTELTKKGVPFHWDSRCQQIFTWLKDYFTRAPLLSYPMKDGGQFILDTDASNEGIGAVLSQKQNEQEKVIAFASKTLSSTRKRYCTTYRELYAVVYFVKSFRVYLLGRSFLLRTDHASLTWLLNFKDLESGMLARWLSTLSEYDFVIFHRPGRQHGNADGLSRRPETRKCKRSDCPVCAMAGVHDVCLPKNKDHGIQMSEKAVGVTVYPSKCKHNELVGERYSGTESQSKKVHQEYTVNNSELDCVEAGTADITESRMTQGVCSKGVQGPESQVEPGDLIDSQPVRAQEFNDIGLPGRRLPGENHKFRNPGDIIGAPSWMKSSNGLHVIQDRQGSSEERRSGWNLCGSRVPRDQLSASNGEWPSPIESSKLFFSMHAASIDILSSLSWDYKSLYSEQRNDKAISWIIDKMLTEKPQWRDILSESADIKILWSQWELLEIHNNLLYKKANSKRGKRVVLPRKLCKEVFSQLHDKPLGGHRGVNKIIDDLRSRVFWPGMKQDVQSWVQTCVTCQKMKAPQPKGKAALQSIPVSAPLDRVQLDIVGPLRTTANGNTYILVLVDYFTKWAEAWAIPDHTAQTVADIVVKEFICRYGIMRQLHTDQGREFQSRLMAEMCLLLGIQKTNTAPYRPNSDGLVERMNRTILTMLRTLADNDIEWDEELPFVLAAYRATMHSSTRCTPNKLMLGRENTMPIDITLGRLPDLPEVKCEMEYAEWLKESLREAHELANKHLGMAVQRQKRNYGGCDPFLPNNFKVGDWVLRLYPSEAKKKLGVPWNGPFLVIRQITPLLYEIQKDKHAVKTVVHCDHLKKYFSDNLPELWVSNSDSLVNERLEDENCAGVDSSLSDLEDQTIIEADTGNETDKKSPHTNSENELTFTHTHKGTPGPERPKRCSKPPDRYGEWTSI